MTPVLREGTIGPWDDETSQALMAFWATLGSCLVQLVAPEAGGSGAAENKGTLERPWNDVGDVAVVCRCGVVGHSFIGT